MEHNLFTNPQPIGIGYFGNIYDQFRGKVKAAFDFLITNKSGDLLGVFNDDELGEIDLVWGSQDEKTGLDHIISKHVGEGKDFANIDEARQTIEEIINTGEKPRTIKTKSFSNLMESGWWSEKIYVTRPLEC